MENVIRDAVTYTEQAKRKTVTAMGVVENSVGAIILLSGMNFDLLLIIRKALFLKRLSIISNMWYIYLQNFTKFLHLIQRTLHFM